MKWTDDLLTGIQEIDAQHRALFDVLAELESAIGAVKKWSAVHYALVDLEKFAQIHFVVEEALMRLHGYPDLEPHIAEHKQFSSKLKEIKAHSIRKDVSEEMTSFLKKWLTEHIGGSDRAYVPHLRTAGVASGANPG